MATIKDIAREAGVSQGTVSNVLNGKGCVSSDKILLVEQTAAKLGYTINQRAKTLRKGLSNSLAAVLPNIIDQCYLDFYLSFKHYAEQHNYSVTLSITDNIQQEEIAQLENLQSEMVAGAAIFTCLTGTLPEKYNSINSAPERIVFMERKQGENGQYIGFDYRKAGCEIAEKVAKAQNGVVAIITESLEYSDQFEFYNGFSVEYKKSNRRMYHLQTDIVHCYNHYLQMIREIGEPDVLVFSRPELARRFNNMAASLLNKKHPQIYSISPLFTMPVSNDFCYELNYRLMGKIAAEALINYAQSTPNKIVLKNDGFRGGAEKTHVKSETTITVLTLDSPTAHIMEGLSRLYAHTTGINVKIAVSTYDSIYELLSSAYGLEAYDVIRLDHTWLSGFAQKIFSPLDELEPNIHDILDTFIPGLIPNFSTVEGKIYTLPETPSSQILFFRKDLFESTIIQRLYKEQYKEELKPPTDYRSFNQIARFFTRQFNPNSPTEYGTTMTLGNTGVAATEFLSRYFSHTSNLFTPDGELLLNSETALIAMKELIEAKQYSPNQYSNWWRDTARTFALGNTAMTVLFSNYASEMLNSNSHIIGNIGFAPAPGNNSLVGGGCIGVCKSSKHKKEAVDFIKWVCSDKIATAMTLLGSVSPCQKTYENFEVVDTYPWLTLSKESIATSRTNRTPQKEGSHFDERRFLGILGMAVNNAYNAVMSEKDALAFAQETYNRTLR